MEKITAWLSNGQNEIYLDGFIKTDINSKIVINNVSIFWRFRNIHEDNREVTLVESNGKQTVLQFEMGYWTFDMISELLSKKESVTLKKNRHNNTCRIHSDKYEIHLGNFGLLIGFEKDIVITRGVTKDSGEVNVNSGLRFFTIGCDIVNDVKNFCVDGCRSKTIATFPITTEEPLFNYVSYYKDVNFEAPVINGVHNCLKFFVDTNVEEEVEMNILIECYLR